MGFVFTGIKPDKKEKSVDFFSLMDFKMKILLATEKPFAKAAVAGIREIVENEGHELVLLEKYSGKEQLLEAIEDADALIVRSDKVTSEVIEAARNLRIIVRAGAGYDNVDLPAATARKIVVMNTPGQNSNAVAELAVGMMIFMSRNQFNPGTGTEIHGKRLGIHAYGNVGRLVAKYCKGFGMEVFAYDPFITDNAVYERDGVKPVGSVEELYSVSDFVSIHIPANERTKKMVNYELLGRMPQGATIINTARKEVIDEEGLVRIMAERDDIKYATDITADMQVILNEKFGLRVFATGKKMGAETKEANVNAALAAARQITDFFAKGDVTFQVNKW